MLLVFIGSVADLTEAMEEHCARQAVAGLALVELLPGRAFVRPSKPPGGNSNARSANGNKATSPNVYRSIALPPEDVSLAGKPYFGPTNPQRAPCRIRRRRTASGPHPTCNESQLGDPLTWPYGYHADVFRPIHRATLSLGSSPATRCKLTAAPVRNGRAHRPLPAAVRPVSVISN
jgi:hypothetical protein